MVEYGCFRAGFWRTKKHRAIGDFVVIVCRVPELYELHRCENDMSLPGAYCIY
jgi:hypothetical protein